MVASHPCSEVQTDLAESGNTAPQSFPISRPAFAATGRSQFPRRLDVRWPTPRSRSRPWQPRNTRHLLEQESRGS